MTRSRRSLEMRLDDLDPNGGDLPLATLAHFLSMPEKIESTETKGIVPIDDELHRTPTIDLEEVLNG